MLAIYHHNFNHHDHYNVSYPNFQKDQVVFLNQKGESQTQLSAVAGSLNSLKLNIEERRASERGGLQYRSEEQDQHGDTPVSNTGSNLCVKALLSTERPAYHSIAS